MLSIAFVILGLGLFIAAGVFTWDTRTFIKKAVSTVGRVVELEYQDGISAKREGYVAVFIFTDTTGQQHTNRAGAAQNPPTHQVGDAVTVLYPVNQPAVAKIRSFRALWIVPTFLGAFGLAFTLVGSVACWQVEKVYSVSSMGRAVQTAEHQS